jgi:prepilin-type N-terminal cleavage/methylation domain-containing protein
MKRHEKMNGPARTRRKEGFSLLEVIVGMTLVAIAVLGLAEMFTVGILNNLRSERITNASFLAQQQVDLLRNLSAEELTALEAGSGVDLNGDGTPDILKEEMLDINNDSHLDYRRITEVQADASGANINFSISVLVFSGEELNTAKSELVLNPQKHGIKSKVDTVISR